MKTRSPPGKELASARRFKAREAKGREQSSSVWRGWLLTECLCLNFNPPASSSINSRDKAESEHYYFIACENRDTDCAYPGVINT